jgi:hypothetical protein
MIYWPTAADEAIDQQGLIDELSALAPGTGACFPASAWSPGSIRAPQNQPVDAWANLGRIALTSPPLPGLLKVISFTKVGNSAPAQRPSSGGASHATWGLLPLDRSLVLFGRAIWPAGRHAFAVAD